METMGGMAVGLVVDGINAVLEKREASALHRKVAPELVVRESTQPTQLGGVLSPSQPIFYLTAEIILKHYSHVLIKAFI